MFMPKRDIMHLRSNTRCSALVVFIFLLAAGISAQQQPQTTQQSSEQAAPAGPHREGTDGIWVDQYGVPLEDQSGKAAQAPPPQPAATTNTGNAGQPGA